MTKQNKFYWMPSFNPCEKENWLRTCWNLYFLIELVQHSANHITFITFYFSKFFCFYKFSIIISIDYAIMLSGGFNAAPRFRHGWRKRLPRHDLLEEERWPFLSKEKGLELFPSWAFIRFIRIGMQIKLINHCQPVRIKQYRIYREQSRA